MKRIAFSLAVLSLAIASTAADPQPQKTEIDVQVIAILASEHKNVIDPRLRNFAAQVQKKEPGLTGFRVERTTEKPLELGATDKFTLIGVEAVEVTVNKERNDKGRITLTIKPPGLDQITYECTCDKFFSVATQHYVGEGKNREQLFVAVMAKPCGLKK